MVYFGNYDKDEHDDDGGDGDGGYDDADSDGYIDDDDADGGDISVMHKAFVTKVIMQMV